MPRYATDHKGRSVEVVTYFLSQKCKLLVDGRQVDSAAVPFIWGTTKLHDTGGSGMIVNVTTSCGVFPKVTLLADGHEIPLGFGWSRGQP
jgi:hypothetical protein